MTKYSSYLTGLISLVLVAGSFSAGAIDYRNISGPIKKMPTTEIYTAGAESVYHYARGCGFNFSIPRKDTGSTCKLHGHNGNMRGTASAPFIVSKCEFLFFDNRSLAPEWTLADFEAKPTTGCDRDSGKAWLKKPTLGSNNIVFKVRVWADPMGNVCSFLLSELRLKGPSGKSWQDAFK